MILRVQGNRCLTTRDPGLSMLVVMAPCPRWGCLGGVCSNQHAIPAQAVMNKSVNVTAVTACCHSLLSHERCQDSRIETDKTETMPSQPDIEVDMNAN